MRIVNFNLRVELMFRSKHKFNAKRTEFKGRKYPSKLEGAYAKYLYEEKEAGRLLFHFEQVPIHLPGGVTYRLDFMEFWANGDIIFTETKGILTPDFKIKWKLVEETYPFKLNIVKKVPKSPSP